MTTIMIHEYDDDDDDDDEDDDDDGDAGDNGNEPGVRLMLMMMMMLDNSLFFTSICHQDIFRWGPQPNPFTTQNMYGLCCCIIQPLQTITFFSL